MSRWHPIASDRDVPPRHVFHGELEGHELAVWRADDGYVNVWDNRCMHRGVRLSIGVNDGAELLCRYHGWRYANRSGGCVYIPAHPADASTRTLTAATYPVAERYGMIWSTLDRNPTAEPPHVAELKTGQALGLRNLPVNASATQVERAILSHRFAPTDDLGCNLDEVAMVAQPHQGYVVLRASLEGAQSTAVFFVQPVGHDRSVIRPVLETANAAAADPNHRDANLVPLLRHHANQLQRLVDSIERSAQPNRAPVRPKFAETPVALHRANQPTGHGATIDVKVVRKWPTADDIAAFELAPVASTPLPAFQPGAHIDLHLPNGLVRQYSLTNGPGDTEAYRIGVKLEPDSSGGSRLLHDVVQEGDLLQVSEPRNGFVLRRNRPHTLLIAGGIGVTPLLAMAQALRRDERAFELHCFVRSGTHLAFGEIIESIGEDFVTTWESLPAQETAETLTWLLGGGVAADSQVYACGPPGMLDAIRSIASVTGWSDEHVHFEYFDNETEIDDGTSFEVALARSAMTLKVSAGESLLDALRAEGIAVTSSCEKGACGTCQVAVLEGTLVHNDVYLNAREIAANNVMLACVSRAASERVVLDL